RPSQSVNALLDYHWSFGLDTGATLTHVGRSFDNAANTRRLQGYVLADLRAAYPLTKAIAVTARVENLFDEKYETTFGYGTPGRAAYGGIRLSY
ncbi:MAG: TonB-dependent receptor domain-containing protein, partial [Janthinobacterium lividum]